MKGLVSALLEMGSDSAFRGRVEVSQVPEPDPSVPGLRCLGDMRIK